MSDSLKQKFDVLKAQLAADKKKAAILGVLAIVLLVVVGRMFFSSGPDATAAAPPAPPTSVTPVPPAASAQPAPQAPIPASPSAGTGQPPQSAEAQVERRTVSISGMPQELARDLFNTKEWNKFMPAVLVDATADTDSKKDRKKPGFWGRLRRSWADYNRENQEVTKAFNTDLERLVLQSTMTGPEPMAYISGRLVRPGDDIFGFSVVGISDREVVVARGSMKASLAMK